jgi:hypothetical protein
MDMEMIVILLLVAFILGLMIGVSISRPVVR